MTFLPQAEAGALHKQWRLLLTLTLAGLACYALVVIFVVGKRPGVVGVE